MEADCSVYQWISQRFLESQVSNMGMGGVMATSLQKRVIIHHSVVPSFDASAWFVGVRCLVGGTTERLYRGLFFGSPGTKFAPWVVAQIFMEKPSC